MTGHARSRLVVVTGAARGIGLGIARRFVEGGDRVVLADRDAAAAAEAADVLRRDGGDASSRMLDVRDPDGVASGVRHIEASLGPIDVWVNNAGVALRGPAVSLARADWQESLDVMLSGAFWCSQAVGRGMLERGSGVIVNIASVNGRQPIEGRVAYSVAKAGLISLTEALGIEWAPRGVRVVGVAPGVVMTDLVAGAIASGAASRATYERRTPMRRLGTVAEVAEAVCFLASDQASYIVGETLFIDGGWTAYQLF